jgi:hypothetical protein
MRLRTERFALFGAGSSVLMGGVLVVTTSVPRPVLFNSQVWKDSATFIAQGYGGPNVDSRARMVDDLLRNHLRAGMPNDHVISILGSGDEGGGEAVGSVVYYYLYLYPTKLQQIASWFRWRSRSPRLKLSFLGGKLTSAVVQ